MSKLVQSRTRASARWSRIKSLTASVNPSAKTSWPRSRSAYDSSSAISGVSSMSRMRLNRMLPLAGTRSETRLFAFARLEIEDPHTATRGVVGALVVLDHCAPSLESAHGESDSLEIVAQVIEHFRGVPVIGEQCVTRVHAHDSVVAIESRFGAHVSSRTALLALSDNVAFLPGCRGRCDVSGHGVLCVWCVCAHRVCATASASAAAAMFTWFFASAAKIRASGNGTPIICHCWLANCCKVAMCSACRWPKRPCSFKYSETGRMLCGRKL